ncbi:MAG: hypothetical protein C4527_23615 [Candidatus Omnitrophota bacterium]|nr:MAG: hypothetical protein C4527_23615 [Candidatus Omnitrophota bacterium]
MSKNNTAHAHGRFSLLLPSRSYRYLQWLAMTVCNIFFKSLEFFLDTDFILVYSICRRRETSDFVYPESDVLLFLFSCFALSWGQCNLICKKNKAGLLNGSRRLTHYLACNVL